MIAAGPPSPPPDAPGLDASAADDAISDGVVPPPPAAAPPAARGGGMLRSSAIYSGLTLVSRFLGFGRDLVVTAVMGASTSVAADAWNTALAFPNLFRRFFAEGAFAAAFVPAYAKSLARDGEEVADILAADAMATLAAATIVLTLAAELTMPWLMFLIAPGFAHDPVKFKLAVTLTQITMPYLPCMAVYAHLSGVLNARGRFIFSALAPSLLNVGTLIAVWPQRTPVGAAEAAAVGAVASGVAQAALLWWGVRKSGARVDVRLPRLTPEIRALIGLAIPGAIAASATQLNVFVSGFLASFVNGARTWLSVADRLYQLPLGLVGVAIGVALLPRLSTAAQRSDGAEAQAATDEAVVIGMALTLPAAAALACMPFFLIDALFTRGEFGHADAVATAAALMFYGVGTPAFVLIRILSPVFFARGDTRGPMRFALVSVALNIVGGALLFQLFHRFDHGGSGQGAEGIAAATAVASWINVAQMENALARRGLYAPSRLARSRLLRTFVAAAVMGGVMAFASATRPQWAHLLGRKEVALFAVVVFGAALYAALLFALRVVTVADLRGAVRRSPGGAAPVAEV